MGIAEKLKSVNERIAKAAQKFGRKPDEILLVAVTKYANASQMAEAINSGVKIIGENRVQVALDKFRYIPAGILAKAKKHFIGTLQSNKVRLAVRHFDAIQSVDSLKLAKEINNECLKINKIMPVFAEVNIGNEETKHGISAEGKEVLEFCNEIAKLTNIKLVGLMCVAPYSENPEDARQYFKQMKELQKKIGVKMLSMGMSNDFEVAIEEGSNMVRIGREIFGEK